MDPEAIPTQHWARALPVEMTPRERKDTVAIVFVLDTSGSMANYVEARQKDWTRN